MTGRSTGADQPDWRDELSCGYTPGLVRTGWAWEFLRRNPAFRSDLIRVLEQVERLRVRESVEVVRSPVDLSRWGVLFRRWRGT